MKTRYQMTDNNGNPTSKVIRTSQTIEDIEISLDAEICDGDSERMYLFNADGEQVAWIYEEGLTDDDVCSLANEFFYVG